MNSDHAGPVGVRGAELLICTDVVLGTRSVSRTASAESTSRASRARAGQRRSVGRPDPLEFSSELV